MEAKADMQVFSLKNKKQQKSYMDIIKPFIYLLAQCLKFFRTHMCLYIEQMCMCKHGPIL